MSRICENAQAITTTAANVTTFGQVAAAQILHRDMYPCAMWSPDCSGSRRRLSKRPSPPKDVPVRPGVGGRGGYGGGHALHVGRPLGRAGAAGGPPAVLWATLVVQRALSS